MSLFSTLYTGASGMGAASTSLAVIGDNIANLNSVGFKRGGATFADLYPAIVGGLAGPQQVGSGTATSAVSVVFGQGLLQATGNALDVAITGSGWFQVNAGERSFFTRDGHFGYDDDGWLVNAAGLKVQGYQAVDGVLSPVVGDVQLDLGPIANQVTTAITMEMSLDADADISTGAPYAALQPTLDGTVPDSLLTSSQEADFSTSVTVYDSLGRSHEVVINFERDPATPNQWTWSAVIDGGEVDLGGVPGVAGAGLEIASGTLSFDTSGNLIGFTQTATATPWTWPGADPWTFDLELGLDAAGNPIDGEAVQLGGASNVSFVSQDGYAQGTLTTLEVDQEGVILGRYTNGEEVILGQLAIALFPSEAGLQKAGGNLWLQTLASGEPALGAASTGGRGGVQGYALETSNVDLEQEFVSMIQAQRTYQANASVIQTADETLQELVNLV